MNQPAPVQHTRDSILVLWHEKQKALAALKEEERVLREQAIALNFTTKYFGTNILELGRGYALKAVFGQTYTVLDNSAVSGVKNDYSHIPEMLKKLPPEVQQNLLSWKYVPTLNVAVYEDLTPEQQSIVNQFILIKDKAPSLSLEEPTT